MRTSWKKYRNYDLKVDKSQNDMAKEIKLTSLAKPHMRAFHGAWWGFFIAFFIWFAILPLVPAIQKDVHLTNNDIWMSNVAGVGGTIFVRLVLGPFCDVYGPRKLFGWVLCLASIPTACVGLVNSATGFILIRLFIGLAGGTFVMCQYWTSVMFTKEIVGTANGIVGGWGNLGAGVTNLVIGMVLLPLFQIFTGGDEEKAWRTVCIVPAFMAFVTGLIIIRPGWFDDSPKGNYFELKQKGSFSNPELSAWGSFKAASLNFNSWLLFIQYACCFGVELTMTLAAASFFSTRFDLSRESAAAIASLFGWMNLFARGAGGLFSDIANFKYGLTGRIYTQAVLLLFEGIFVIVFSMTHTLAAAIVVMVLFSFFVQASEGSTYGIVPYVDQPHTGSVTGIVGAGGNVGAVCFGLVFKAMPDSNNAFLVVGGCVIFSSLLSLFICVGDMKSFGPFSAKGTDNENIDEEAPTNTQNGSSEEDF